MGWQEVKTESEMVFSMKSWHHKIDQIFLNVSRKTWELRPGYWVRFILYSVCNMTHVLLAILKTSLSEITCKLQGDWPALNCLHNKLHLNYLCMSWTTYCDILQRLHEGGKFQPVCNWTKSCTYTCISINGTIVKGMIGWSPQGVSKSQVTVC